MQPPVHEVWLVQHYITACQMNVTDAHLITDEFPLLLVVILPQQTCFVRRKIHRVLQERKNIRVNWLWIMKHHQSHKSIKNWHPRLTKTTEAVNPKQVTALQPLSLLDHNNYMKNKSHGNQDMVWWCCSGDVSGINRFLPLWNTANLTANWPISWMNVWTLVIYITVYHFLKLFHTMSNRK